MTFKANRNVCKLVKCQSKHGWENSLRLYGLQLAFTGGRDTVTTVWSNKSGQGQWSGVVSHFSYLPHLPERLTDSLSRSCCFFSTRTDEKRCFQCDWASKYCPALKKNPTGTRWASLVPTHRTDSTYETVVKAGSHPHTKKKLHFISYRSIQRSVFKPELKSEKNTSGRRTWPIGWVSKAKKKKKYASWNSLCVVLGFFPVHIACYSTNEANFL